VRTSHLNQELLAPLIRLVADRAANPAIHSKKICLLLGAGADISSGGLTFAELKRQTVKEYLKTSVFDLTTEADIEEQFESFFAELKPDDRAILLEHLFRRMQTLQPSDAYKLLVLLAEAGGIDAVVTTNFDLMLEAAQSQLGRNVFQVYAPGIARPYIVSHPRFELVKKPYLKLHGDLESRAVMLLTSAELETPSYDDSMVQLLKSILSSHDLIIAGYSGNDPALARIIAESVSASENRIFWCARRSPDTNSALFMKIGSRVTAVLASFDELMMELARPVLERPSLAATTPTYVGCLFEWRLDYCNREYSQAYGERHGKSIVDIFVPRRSIEDRLTSFLRPNHPLAIISGPSGCGKTTIGLRMLKRWQADDSTKIMLIRSRALPESGDIEQHITEQLGGLGSHVPFSLFALERWLKEQGTRLILYIDGINEFSPDLSRCIHLFRTILRFCYFLPELDSALRVIVTVRQETWNSMLAHIDTTQLLKTVWSEADHAQSLSTIPCGPFDDEELTGALARLKHFGFALLDTTRMSPSSTSQLHDPYLLGALMDLGPAAISLGPTASVFQQVMESRIRQRGSLIDTATLKDTLANLALLCLHSPQERFREVDVNPAFLRGELLRLTKDLHIIVDAGGGFYRFDHDRTFEYFLALSIATGDAPKLETIDDVGQFLKHFKNQSKPTAAARLYFQLAPQARFSIIEEGLKALDKGRFDTYADREGIFSFARDVFFEMVEQGEPVAWQYLHDAVNAARIGAVGELHLRTLVQAAANLPSEEAVPLLTKAASGTTQLAETEAGIYVIDKLVKQYLSDSCPAVDLLTQEPYATFFSDPSVTSPQRLGRVLSFASQIGPDNTHPDEYHQLANVLTRAIGDLTRVPWSLEDAKLFLGSFLKNCDRLLFNATASGINRFFGNPNRAQFEAILERLASGAILNDGDFALIEPYTQSLSADVEYHLSHLLVVLSSMNDLEGTLRMIESRFDRFSNLTPPEEVDFFEAALVYIHVLHGTAYDPNRFSKWEERILREWPNVLLYRPGQERGERRGFSDPFDRVFEDGFGVIYPYGVLLPSIFRRTLHYKEYVQALAKAELVSLPLYSEFLAIFLAEERIEPALQLLQALSGVIVDWPIEGLKVLQSGIGHSDPRIRRATVRILAEAFNRHPDETLTFLRLSGAAVSDEDFLQIKIRQDARIGRRQISEEEWARIGHILLMSSEGRTRFVACLRALLRAESLESAFIDILYELKLLETGR
jgi:hypothetical protein